MTHSDAFACARLTFRGAGVNKFARRQPHHGRRGMSHGPPGRSLNCLPIRKPRRSELTDQEAQKAFVKRSPARQATIAKVLLSPPSLPVSDFIWMMLSRRLPLSAAIGVVSRARLGERLRPELHRQQTSKERIARCEAGAHHPCASPDSRNAKASDCSSI